MRQTKDQEALPADSVVIVAADHVPIQAGQIDNGLLLGGSLFQTLNRFLIVVAHHDGA